MFVLEFCPLDTSERREFTQLCQRFLQSPETDLRVAQETLVALCALAGAPHLPTQPLTSTSLWQLRRLVWNYATAPRMLLSETIWLAQRLQ